MATNASSTGARAGAPLSPIAVLAVQYGLSASTLRDMARIFDRAADEIDGTHPMFARFELARKREGLA